MFRVCVLLTMVSLLAACGRLGFEQVGDDASAFDATEDDFDPSVFVGALSKKSVVLPLLDQPDDPGGAEARQCGNHAMNEIRVVSGHRSNRRAQVVMPSVTYEADKFWIFYPCQTTNSDNGWSLGLAEWDGMSVTAMITKPGPKGLIAVDTNSPVPIASIEGFRATFGTVGITPRQLYGTASIFSTGQGYERFPMSADVPEMLNATSIDVIARNGLSFEDSDKLQAQGLSSDIEFDIEEGIFYLYGLWWDRSSKTPDGSDSSSIGLVRSKDMKARDGAASVLIEGWSDPMVSFDNGKFHMVARKLEDNYWYYVRGTGPANFDFDGGQRLDLLRFQGNPGDWDYDRYRAQPRSDQPDVADALVVKNMLYIFYVAGTPKGATGEDFKRGTGVITAQIRR
jgi:hypothetical protein